MAGEHKDREREDVGGAFAVADDSPPVEDGHRSAAASISAPSVVEHSPRGEPGGRRAQEVLCREIEAGEVSAVVREGQEGR